MRLVNHEFEEKVSTYLFRTVVVPFRPEIYGLAEESAADGEDGRVALMLQDKGMRVFQGFGKHIRRFAMSFEVDYAILTSPPAKSDQEAITTFWGIYRWPFKKYNRYAQLEGLEQTADETMTMAKALKYVEHAQELGLSMDGGLGWLSGPDINPKVPFPSNSVSVFGTSRYPREEAQLESACASTTNSFLGQSGPSKSTNALQPRGSFQRMLGEAGYEGERLNHSMRTLMESEGHAQEYRISTFPDISHSEYGLMDGTRESTRLGTRAYAESLALKGTTDSIESYPLKPNNLSNAQREMLLEIEWAQRAFIQSYIIAIMDNPLTFKSVTTLTVARLPFRHLNALRRDDFWASLNNLETFSLAVIPDWREVAKLPTSWVEDIKQSPSQAVTGVYHLLNDHVGLCENIKSLHFEWLCGGEQATGLFARNQLILAAPLIPSSSNMISRRATVPVLQLPHVEHLTLKNCWVSPHIFQLFIKRPSVSQLQTLVLDSISLCAHIPHNAAPAPINNGQQQDGPANGNHALNVLNAHAFNGLDGLAGAAAQHAALQAAVMQQINNPGMAPQPLAPAPVAQVAPVAPVPTPLSPKAWLEPPREDSWAETIDIISPSRSLASFRHEYDSGPEPEPREQTILRNIKFKSCGYVRLPLDFDQSMLEPANPEQAETASILKRRSDLSSYMMKPTDHTLGTVVNYIDRVEEQTLYHAWGLDMGWTLADSNKIGPEAQADGIKNPGQGRFRGTVIAPPLPRESRPCA